MSHRAIRSRYADLRRNSRNFMGVRVFNPAARFGLQHLVNPEIDEAVIESIIRSHRELPRYAAGDLKQKYGTIGTFTVTNLQSLASSSTYQAGWTSAYVDNTTNLYLNSAAYGQVTAGTNPTAGSVRAYMYAYDGTNALTFSSAGTPGTEGTLTITDSEQLDGFLTLIWEEAIDTTTNDVYPMGPRGVRAAFNGFYPRNWALYVAHNSVAALKSTGNAMYADHELGQYT